jgi:hypothetical protein
MAKILKNIFVSGSDEIVQDYTVESWHVSQSVDAFTGASDYDITISGSLDVTGPLDVTGNSSVSGYSTVNGFIIYNTGSNIAIVESSIFTPSTDVGKSLNVRLGYAAGQSTADTIGSNIIGSSAGVSAQSASYSNFLGMGAGGFATFASGSNFIGYVAGQFSSLASYSNLFGYNVGRGDIGGDSIGSNNIIIGTNISLPYNYKNGINIGAVIFGSGSYATPTGNVFSGSVGNGRIGINQPNPSFNLDISGSGRYTNGVTVTGSFTSSGSLSILSTGSITLNGPITLTGSLSTSGSVNLRGLTTESKSFLVTIDNTTGQLYYTSSAAAIAATTPSLPFNSFQYNNAGAFAGSNALTFVSSNAIRATGSFTGSFVGNLTGSATTLSTDRTNWSTNGTITAVVGQLAWRNYGNNHTIFDASAGASPEGVGVNNTNPSVEWTATYPTLMGWNGTNTYGVRVDSSRYAENIKNTGTVTLASSIENNEITITQPTIVINTPVKLLNFRWYSDTWSIGNIRSNTATSLGLGIFLNSTEVGRFSNTSFSMFSRDIIAFATSDKRLKDNITPISNPIEKIQKIGGYEFDWIPTEDIHSYEGHDIGVVAQEIEEVLPELVTTRDNGYKAVKYEKIVALLIEAIKDQQKQIDDLKSKIK